MIEADGKRGKKEVVGYRKKVECLKEKEERKQLEERLPKHLFSHKLNKKADKEIKKDSSKLHHRHCDVGIEINLPNHGRKRFFFCFFSLVIVIG